VAIWRPGEIWAGERCFVIGGGPSLLSERLDGLSGERVIVVNGAGALMPDADILFFNDSGWLQKHEALVCRWPGTVVTSSTRRLRLPATVERVATQAGRGFPPKGGGMIKWGPSSGHRAVATAVMLGARWVGLLGFDMREVEGRTHFHDEYRNHPARYSDLFLPGFLGWARAAAEAGVEIVNLTQGSALKEFPMATLREVL
jgi:hypothetical protein